MSYIVLMCLAKNFSVADLQRIHVYSIGIGKTGKAGCFYCEAVFDASEAAPHKGRKNSGDFYICPKCGIDSVLCESDGVDITPELLKAMYEYWFMSDYTADESLDDG